MRLSKDQIAAILTRELSQAQGYNSDTLASKRSAALDYYQGLSPAPPDPYTDLAGNVTVIRSGIVSMDLADCLHSLMAQIQPIVKTTAVEFDPDSEQDEPQAQAESDLVRKMIERASGYTAVFSACHDAFMSGNGWICIEAEEVEETVEKCYPPGLTPEQLAYLAEPQQDGEKRVVEQDDDETCVYVTSKSKRLIFRAVPPEDIFYSGAIGVSDVSGLRMLAERRLFTTSQLLGMGISKEDCDSIPDNLPSDNTGDLARQGIYQYDAGNTATAAQESEQQKVVYICYVKLDMTGNGKSELRCCWMGGNKLIYDDSEAFIPYVTGSVIPMPHRIEGVSLFELLKSIQDGKSHVLRNYMDNLAAMNQSRVGAVEGQVNMGDLTNGRINGVVRMRSPDAIVPLPSADIGPQAMAGLNYLDQVRTQRVGSAVDFNEAQAQIMGSSATAAAGQLAKVEQMAGWFAANLVETLIKAAFLMTHRILREEMAGPVGGKIRGQWQQMDSSQWPVRKNLAVVMGMTSMERAAKIQGLAAVIGYQAQILQSGGDGVLCDLSKTYNSLADWIRANNLGSPDEYLIDPTSQPAQQAQAAKAEQAQQQQAQMAQIQQQLMQMQHHFDMAKQQAELDYKQWSDELKAQIEEMKLHNQTINTASTNQTRKEVAEIGSVNKNAAE
jgi:hypothetical protein